ncbi:hypothetical protein K2X33_15500 [bacterium]|nr:hypothetical protein [bacterium]
MLRLVFTIALVTAPAWAANSSRDHKAAGGDRAGQTGDTKRVTPASPVRRYEVPTETGQRLLNPQTEPLISFCTADCTGDTSGYHDCWVPSDGRLASVPAESSGASLCEALRDLCKAFQKANAFQSWGYTCKNAQGQIVLEKKAPKMAE